MLLYFVVVVGKFLWQTDRYCLIGVHVLILISSVKKARRDICNENKENKKIIIIIKYYISSSHNSSFLSGPSFFEFSNVGFNLTSKKNNFNQ